jgi:dTDP-4-amino-4,6-dideoxygalactose transaminase
MELFINKAWGYGDERPDHYFLALNYRMSELQGAVALAQLSKLQEVVDSRRRRAADLTERLDGLAGIRTPRVTPRGRHTYWKYCLRVDEREISGGVVEIARRLKERGIVSAPRYIQKPAFMCELFQRQRTFGSSRYPFTLARPEALDYDRSRFPGTFEALQHVLVLPWNECYTDEHVAHIEDSLREAVSARTPHGRS